MSRILIFRHAESLANADKTVYAYPECANILTRKGVEQAMTVNSQMDDILLKHFNNEPFTVISSKLIRAKLTAEIAMSGFYVPVIEDHRFNEVAEDNFGRTIETREALKHRFNAAFNEYPGNLIIFTHCNAMMFFLDTLKFKNLQFVSLDRSVTK